MWDEQVGSGTQERDGAHAAAFGADRERPVDPEVRLQAALDIGYTLLARRDRTVAEVRAQLESKRTEPATIDAAVAELLELNYLDDGRYAQRFAEDRRTLDSWGPDRIERKLLALGVAPEHIAAALSTRDSADELDAALAILRRRFTRPAEDQKSRDRALGILVRKGYDLELAYDAVRAFERTA
ncbi:Regulatory protein RecX [Paraconexibacter sp. AEG42_29]|uniref:Regulatory protein RecX n=1 Tax=Paraconexibacter sp. AEG42_29 TaxID=2997339 RepID=A0AAU7AVV0_9ACTN